MDSTPGRSRCRHRTIELFALHCRQDLPEVAIQAAPADHGDLSASALSLLLDFAGTRVLLTGDTAYRPALLRPLCESPPNVLLPCINGVFGNMDPIDAARLVQDVRPRYALPCHYWTFAKQGNGDPAGFLYACKQFCPNVQSLLLRPGEAFSIAVAVPRPNEPQG